MANPIQWSSSPPTTEAFEVFTVTETTGHPGTTPSAASDAADDLIVVGKSDSRLLPARTRLGNEAVIGVDERVRISDTDKLPWRKIAALTLKPKPPFSSSFIGTGWFIGPKTLLTAGHCVFNKSDFGGWIGSIEISPGRNGAKFPYGTVTATRFSATQVWQDNPDPDYDIGCIHLDHPIVRFQDDPNVATVFRPLDGTKLLSPGKVSRILGGDTLAHDCSTTNGSSGSPVIDFGSYRAVGLHYFRKPGERNEAVLFPAITAHAVIVKYLAQEWGI